MKTRIKMLKVKIKSLAEEARIIRQEEERAKGRRKCPSGVHPDHKVFLGRDDELRMELRGHRVGIVRSEQRHSLLAYAFLRGRPLAKVEAKCEAPPDWSRVAKLVEKFGVVGKGAAHSKQAEEFATWRTAVAA